VGYHLNHTNRRLSLCPSPQAIDNRVFGGLTVPKLNDYFGVILFVGAMVIWGCPAQLPSHRVVQLVVGSLFLLLYVVEDWQQFSRQRASTQARE
jgi:hypothetical protein